MTLDKDGRPVVFAGGGKQPLPMPADRHHRCHCVNGMGIPTDWVEYDPAHGYELRGTDMYGEDYLAKITFCPWCGRSS